MTDKDKLMKLLTELDIEFKVKDRGKQVYCEQGMENVDGYMGFFTFFDFDDNGAFLVMGAEE